MKSIVVALAGGAPSIITAKYAIYLAKLLQVKLIAICVIDEKAIQELLKSRVFVEIEAKEYEIDMDQQSKLFMQRVKALAENKKVECETLILKGEIHSEVVDKAKELGADLLVMGDLKEVLSWQEALYSEGERIFRESTCPVVVVKNPILGRSEVERLYNELQ
ncbi:MAG: universal stress protein [Candidatus Omnitrophica bacterium]|nr:universal stress protein [Candidatus Omnitrophota bacterium]